MISIELLVEYLQQTSPNVDRGATLAGLNQVGGTSSTTSGTLTMTVPISSIPIAIVLPTTVPSPSIPTPTEPYQQKTAPSKTPKQPQSESLDVIPRSACQDPGIEEENAEGERIPEEEMSRVEKDKMEETPVKKPWRRRGRRRKKT